MSLPPATSVKAKSVVAIDNKNLINDLWKSAKPSYSTLGRSLDFSRENVGDKEDVPRAVSFGASLNRKERDRLLKRLAAQQKEWGAADEAPQLHIPTLPTMAPSFTKAADEGVEALGGTKMGRPGYVSLIGLVPTSQTVKCIEDNFELISSFRPYQHDARRAAKEAAVRENAAPHPDLLSQLRPIFQGICPAALIDVGALPLYIFEDQNKAAKQDDESALLKDEDEEGKESLIQVYHPKSSPPDGTYPFINQGRGVIRPRLPGRRSPVLGQYHPHFTVVEPRITHGYIAPVASVNAKKAVSEEVLEVPHFTEVLPPEPSVHLAESVMGESMVRSSGGDDERSIRRVDPGSWVFNSRTERRVERVSAAPDKMYWPYPDVRSTSKRVVCPVNFKVRTSHRRRDLHVSGVPAGVYNVTRNMGEGVHDLAMMATTTGRDNHWYGRKDPTCANASSNDTLDVETALKAIRPHVMETKLPARVEFPSSEQGQEEKKNLVASNVSKEENPYFSKSYVGSGEKLHQVRAFDKMVSCEGLSQPKPLGLQLDYAVNYDLEKPRKRAVEIHPRAPGHGSLHQPHPTELGEIPNLKWVKPKNNRTTEFGVGSARPDHLLPLKDLTYHVEPGYPYVEPRVRGNPMIGTTINRSQREKISSCKPNGAEVMYDNLDIKPKVKNVSLFEKQITKETQFCGHNIQSERWLRNNPRAPGPGYYDVKYTQVE